MAKADIRPIDKAVVEAFYGHEVPHPVVASGGFLDDALVAVWGLAWWPSGCWAFWQCKDEALRYRIMIMREAKAVLKLARQIGERTVLSAGDDRETSIRIHQHLGFTQIGVHDGMRVWRWPR